MAERPDGACAFLRAMASAAGSVQRNSTDAAALLSEVTGLSPVVATEAMSLHSFELGLGLGTVESLRRTAAFLGRTGHVRGRAGLRGRA